MICGIDEVGRGSLAGVILSGAVVLGDDFDIKLFDSKKINEKKREKLDKIIRKKCLCFAFGVASSFEIDAINIHNANLLSFKRAFSNLKMDKKLITEVLVDGKFIPDIKGYKIEAIIKGDDKIKEIKAASILAKVKRDNIMKELSKMEKYSHFEWQNNKGYPTKKHKEAIKNHYISNIHRLSFNLN